METLVFHRVASDACGNPRYVVDYSNLLTDAELQNLVGFSAKYPVACKRANSIGGRKFDTKTYRGGIVFQSYSVDETAAHISRVTGRTFKAER